MSGVEITITGVGAYLAPLGQDRRRPFGTGDTLTVDEETAERLINDGVAVRKGDEPKPVEPDTTVGDGFDDLSDEDLAGRTVDELRDLVGDDADRAARVLDIEEGKGDKARSTLTEPLQALIDGDGEGGEDG